MNDDSVTSRQATQALNAISDSEGKGVGAATDAPWWYGPSLYACVGVFVASPAIDAKAVLFSAFGVFALLMANRGRFVGANPKLPKGFMVHSVLIAGPVLGGLFVAGLVGRYVFGFGEAPWLAGAAACIAAYLIDLADGHRYEKLSSAGRMDG